MKRILVFLVAVVVLSGCATASGLEKKLAAINGLSEADLIRSMGTPQQIYDSGHSRFLTYASSRFVMVPTAYGNIGNTRSCQITFEIHNGFVVGSSWKGNDCKA